MFCTLLLNLNGPFLNIILRKTCFFQDFPVFPEIMETAACAKCIKTGRGMVTKTPKNEKFLYIYLFSLWKIPGFSGFSVNQVYKSKKSIHCQPPEKRRNRGLFSISFGANGQILSSCAGNPNARSIFCMNIQLHAPSQEKIFSKNPPCSLFSLQKPGFSGERTTKPTFLHGTFGDRFPDVPFWRQQKSSHKGELFHVRFPDVTLGACILKGIIFSPEPSGF